MSNVHAVDHPLVRHHLTKLRDKATSPFEFRQLVGRLSTLLAYEATNDLEIEDVGIETPVTAMVGQQLVGRIGLVPILRAGLGMVDPLLNLLPSAEVWHLGLYRDEQTAQPVRYYDKLPPSRPVDVGIVVDPMLATGGSAAAALETLKNWGVQRLKLLSIIAAPEGIAAVEAAFPDTQVYVCSIDAKLNDQKFIVPGLGDAGDRLFNTLGQD
ncbi:MAG: uracil phosphoribosyltransferase [Planctomycetaceae bacterium]